MTRIKRISPSFVVSSLALFVALSGAAMALPGQNTVNSGDIVNESVKSIDLKDNAAVASSDVIDETLTTTDVAADTLTGDDVAPDSLLAADLAPNSVDSSEIAANGVNSDEIAANAVDSSELANDSVSSTEIGDGVQPRYNTVAVGGGTAENGAYVFNEVTRACLPGEELISGSAEWTGDAAGDELFVKEVRLNHVTEEVTVEGGNDSGSDAQLWAVAHCL